MAVLCVNKMVKNTKSVLKKFATYLSAYYRNRHQAVDSNLSIRICCFLSCYISCNLSLGSLENGHSSTDCISCKPEATKNIPTMFVCLLIFLSHFPLTSL